MCVCVFVQFYCNFFTCVGMCMHSFTARIHFFKLQFLPLGKLSPLKKDITISTGKKLVTHKSKYFFVVWFYCVIFFVVKRQILTGEPVR